MTQCDAIQGDVFMASSDVESSRLSVFRSRAMSGSNLFLEIIIEKYRLCYMLKRSLGNVKKSRIFGEVFCWGLKFKMF